MTSDRTIRDLFKPAPEISRRRIWAPFAVLALGLLSIAMLLWTHRLSERRTVQDLAVVSTLNELQNAVAYWHLWLEEYLTDDPYVVLDRDVRGNQDDAMRLAGELLRGNATKNLVPLEDPRLAKVARDLEQALTRFRNLSEDRLRQNAGVGTELDQAFDDEFHQVRDHSETLRQLLERQLEQGRTAFRHRVWLTVGVWVLIVAAAGAALWRLERQRRSAEETLRTSQKWLATTLSSIGDAVITTDLEGRVFFMNPIAEKLTGWPLEEAAGRAIEDVFQIVREDNHQPAENPVAAVLRFGESVLMTNHTVLLDRHRAECYGIDEGAAPIRDDAGQLLGVVLVFRDVSERRQAEKALHQREIELQQAQKMEAVGRLAGGLAHDVNNYLGAIRGYCEVAVLKSESGAALETRMGSAIETCEKVSALIRQLLAFSRRQPVQPEVVDLNRVVEGMEDLMRRLLGEDVALTTRCAQQLGAIEIDPSQIEQLLVNLLVNARDAMPTGGRILIATDNAELAEGEVEKQPERKPGRYVRLTVRDTGSGIPADVQEKIFDPFFTTKRDTGSSGLGLATVYSVVQQNGGFVSLESEVGEGTTFEIYLPASRESAIAQPATASASVAPTGPVRILLVEDNEDMRASTRSLLETLGHAVQVAPDGEAALALLANDHEPFDLLITDVIMPGISGKELLDRIRQRHGEVRCLFVSGYTDNVMLRHGLDHERVHFLQKPFGFDDLACKIAEVLL
ncbi:MAG: ATP-binding protein [Acidobacteriota bacterium]